MARSFPETESKVGAPGGDKVPHPSKPQPQPKDVPGISSTYNR